MRHRLELGVRQRVLHQWWEQRLHEQGEHQEGEEPRKVVVEVVPWG